MKHCLLIALSAVLLSCNTPDERPRPDTEALVGRQLVVEQFGSEVWESASNYNTFLARCPDGSVWMVVIGRAQGASRWTPELDTRIIGKTMIFPATVPLPTEKP